MRNHARAGSLGAALVAVLVLAGACRGAATPDIPQGAVLLDIREFPDEVTRQWHSGVEQRARLVIRDQAAWSDFWRDATGHETPAPPIPALDFASEMVIVAAMGSRPSGGYAIAIESVQESAAGLHVSVMESSPGPQCMVLTVITAPVVAVRVPRRDGPVAFVEKSQTIDCP